MKRYNYKKGDSLHIVNDIEYIQLDEGDFIMHWNKVEDGLPDNKHLWLLVKYITNDGNVIVFFADWRGQFYHPNVDKILKNITHWAELPEQKE